MLQCLVSGEQWGFLKIVLLPKYKLFEEHCVLQAELDSCALWEELGVDRIWCQWFYPNLLCDHGQVTKWFCSFWFVFLYFNLFNMRSVWPKVLSRLWQISVPWERCSLGGGGRFVIVTYASELRSFECSAHPYLPESFGWVLSNGGIAGPCTGL